MLFGNNGTWVCPLIGPPVVLPPHASLCFRIKHWTEGFMGKPRASARLTPLNMLRTTEEADWSMLLVTNQVCRYAHKLFVPFVVLFLSRILDFRFYWIVNIFCKMRYINCIIQYFGKNWSLIFKCKNTYLAYTNNDLYSGCLYVWTGIFNMLCYNLVKWFDLIFNFFFGQIVF